MQRNIPTRKQAVTHPNADRILFRPKMSKPISFINSNLILLKNYKKNQRDKECKERPQPRRERSPIQMLTELGVA